MRLFVGVGLGEQFTLECARATQVLEARARLMAPESRVAWVPPQRLHITLRFIGQVDITRATAVTAALAAPMPWQPFGIRLAGFGTFPSTGQPRVIWAAIADGAVELRLLEREVTRRLSATGVPPENRRYTPHVTLGRVRTAAGLQGPALFHGLGLDSTVRSPAVAVTLYESRLSPTGAHYVALQETMLSEAVESDSSHG